MIPMKTLSRILTLSLAAAAPLFLAACKPNPERRELQYMPDMYFNPAVKPQEENIFFKDGRGMRVAPEHTISENATHYPYTIFEGDKAGAELKNPLPRTEAVLRTGQKYFNIHCRVCHGFVGSGDGMATVVHGEGRMPIPPQLYSDKIKKWGDGQIYHTITMGQGNMPSYAARIDPINRWAIVHYVRALGAAASPSPEDLDAVKALGWDAKEMDNPYRPDAHIPQLFLGGKNTPPPVEKAH
ncbi:hypothetical protein BH09SUM1_BH09SUM1_01360 [soil metagenome]